MKNKFFLTFEFYKKLFPLIFIFSVASMFFMIFSLFVFVSVFFSFFISILIFEVNNKREYIFYFNNGITKYQLWIISFFINLSILLILLSIWRVIF